MRLLRRITLVMSVAPSSPANTADSLEPRHFGMWSRFGSNLSQQNYEAVPVDPEIRERILNAAQQLFEAVRRLSKTNSKGTNAAGFPLTRFRALHEALFSDILLSVTEGRTCPSRMICSKAL
jgi:hypothetical protein